MRSDGTTTREATREWIKEMDAIQYGIIEALMRADPDSWHEVTAPRPGLRVYVYEVPEELDTLEHGGEIRSYNEESELYCIELDDGKLVSVSVDDFEVEYDGALPMWGTLWSFKDSADDYWLEEYDGIRLMSECGFRVYEHDEYGYFFGIDGCGYSFMEEHWLPLYLARGLQWHDPATIFEVGDKVIFNGKGGVVEEVKYEGYLKVKLDDGETVDASSRELKHADGEYAEKPEEWFGTVRWCEEDLKNSLERLEVPVTEENIRKVRKMCEHHSFTDQMVEAGWDIIDQFVGELKDGEGDE